MLLQEWLPKWLDTYVKPTSKLRTYNRYYEIVYQHIIPQLGMCEIEDVTVYKLQSFVADLMQFGNIKNGQGLSANSVNSIITVVQNSLKTAHTLGLTSEYIGNKIKRPKNSERQIECFSLSEQKKIEEYILKIPKFRAEGNIEQTRKFYEFLGKPGKSAAVSGTAGTE